MSYFDANFDVDRVILLDGKRLITKGCGAKVRVLVPCKSASWPYPVQTFINEANCDDAVQVVDDFTVNGQPALTLNSYIPFSQGIPPGWQPINGAPPNGRFDFLPKTRGAIQGQTYFLNDGDLAQTSGGLAPGPVIHPGRYSVKLEDCMPHIKNEHPRLGAESLTLNFVNLDGSPLVGERAIICYLSPSRCYFGVYLIEGVGQFNYHESEKASETLVIDSFEMLHHDHQYPCHEQGFALKKLGQSIQIVVFPEQIVIDLDDKNFTPSKHIKPNILAYLKTMNSALFFIHGFNVAQGEKGFYANYIPQTVFIHADVLRKVAPFETHKTLAEQKREANRMLQQNPKKANRIIQLRIKNKKLHIFISKYNRVGIFTSLIIFVIDRKFFKALMDDDGELYKPTGAYDWFIQMEKNFNIAAGFKDYTQYTRCIHICWPGDVGILNFNASISIIRKKTLSC